LPVVISWVTEGGQYAHREDEVIEGEGEEHSLRELLQPLGDEKGHHEQCPEEAEEGGDEFWDCLHYLY
jgi:hypothetical protein